MLLFIGLGPLLLCGADRGARRERERRACATLAYGRGERVGSWVNLSACWGLVSVRPGENWLSMLVTDDIHVYMAIVGGLRVRYKL